MRVLLVCILAALSACATSEPVSTGALPPGAAASGAFGRKLADIENGQRSRELGTAVGAWLRQQMGPGFTQAAQAFHDEAARRALWLDRSGVARTWRVPHGAVRGRIIPTSNTYRDQAGGHAGLSGNR
jgi:surface antigen